jgi:hypothetical protein
VFVPLFVPPPPPTPPPPLILKEKLREPKKFEFKSID